MAANRPSEGASVALSTVSPSFKQPDSHPPLLPQTPHLVTRLWTSSWTHVSPNTSSRLLRVSAPGPKSFASCLHQKRGPCRRGRSCLLSGNWPRIRLSFLVLGVSPWFLTTHVENARHQPLVCVLCSSRLTPPTSLGEQGGQEPLRASAVLGGGVAGGQCELLEWACTLRGPLSAGTVVAAACSA